MTVLITTNMRAFHCGSWQATLDDSAPCTQSMPSVRAWHVKQQQQEEETTKTWWRKILSQLQHYLGSMGSGLETSPRLSSSADQVLGTAGAMTSTSSSSRQGGRMSSSRYWSSTYMAATASHGRSSKYHCHGPVAAAAGALVTAVCGLGDSTTATLLWGGGGSGLAGGAPGQRCTCYLPPLKNGHAGEGVAGLASTAQLLWTLPYAGQALIATDVRDQPDACLQRYLFM
jgi:hypothetical protein